MTRAKSLALLGIPAAGALGGGGYGITYLINDEFTTDRAAGNVDGTAAEPGPGTRSVIGDSPAVIEISSSTLTRASTGQPFSDGRGIKWTGITRAAGVAMIATVGNAVFGRFGLTRVSSNVIEGEGGWAIGSIRQINGDFVYTPSALSHVAVVLNSSSKNNAMMLVKDNGSWVLCYITKTYVYSVLQPFLQYRGDGSPDSDYLRVAQLPAPFDTDNGIATDVHSGSVSAGATFSHEADTWIEYTVTTRPTAGQTETRFRVQDGSNYWQVTVDSSGNIDLDEVVSGTPTQRGTAAGVVSSGHRVCIVADDTTITVYSNDVQRFSYASASNFKSATAGELETLGTGGAVSNLITMPRTLSGRAATILNAFAAGQS